MMHSLLCIPLVVESSKVGDPRVFYDIPYFCASEQFYCFLQTILLATNFQFIFLRCRRPNPRVFHFQFACQVLSLDLMSSWSGVRRSTKELASRLSLFGSRQTSLTTYCILLRRPVSGVSYTGWTGPRRNRRYLRENSRGSLIRCGTPEIGGLC